MEVTVQNERKLTGDVFYGLIEAIIDGVIIL